MYCRTFCNKEDIGESLCRQVCFCHIRYRWRRDRPFINVYQKLRFSQVDKFITTLSSGTSSIMYIELLWIFV